MNIFLDSMIFIMGTFFGSFFTLAVYRIPLKKDITHEHSFCPNCNHKLGIWDLIPIFSYLFLKGKCRYCGEKVRIRYLLLEVLSGFVFLVAYKALHIQIMDLDVSKIMQFVFFVAMYITLVLIAGIDKEYRKINSAVLVFGGICQMLYILYLYVIEDASMYRYSIYFVLFFLIFSLNKKKDAYIFQVFNLCMYSMAVVGIKALMIILFLSMLCTMLLHVLQKKKYANLKNIPVGFLIGILTIAYKIVENFVEFY